MGSANRARGPGERSVPVLAHMLVPPRMLAEVRTLAAVHTPAVVLAAVLAQVEPQEATAVKEARNSRLPVLPRSG